MRKLILAAVVAACSSVLAVTQAFACGGLVAPDGDVHLDKATTFVAWHDGTEHYVTSFAYTGAAADVGWIVPLPAVPSSIQPAGRWTLQRLEQQFNPPPVFADALAAPHAASASSVVVEQVQVEALDVTVLKGSGSEVIDWCAHNGFLIPPDTQNHLLRYAKGSPVFMAAKYDTAVAQQRNLRAGDGVPLLITMSTPRLWVPLEVLANDGDQVRADLFLLTDQQLQPVIDSATGLTLVASRQLDGQLFNDLSRDRNMGWLPRNGWLAYLRLDAPSDDVTYDLGVGTDAHVRLASFGTPPAHAGDPQPAAPLRTPLIVIAVACAVAACIAALVAGRIRWARGRYEG